MEQSPFKNLAALVAPSSLDHDPQTQKQVLKALREQVLELAAADRIAVEEVRIRGGLLVVETQDPLGVAEAARNLVGVGYCGVVERHPPELEEVVRAVVAVGSRIIYPGETFKVQVSLRGEHPYVVSDVVTTATARLVAALAEKGARPDEREPRKRVWVEVQGEEAYIYIFRFPGPGGLPQGVAGEGVVLIDGAKSRLAAYLAAQAGLALKLLHASPKPTTPRRLDRLLEALRPHDTPLLLVDTSPLDRALEQAEAPLRPGLRHRALVELAARAGRVVVGGWRPPQRLGETLALLGAGMAGRGVGLLTPLIGPPLEAFRPQMSWLGLDPVALRPVALLPEGIGVDVFEAAWSRLGLSGLVEAVAEAAGLKP
jgi:tRNA(Ser,Leu) C12 N-acetylase TAN1